MGADNGMDASPSWQELKEERDALAAYSESGKRIVREWGGGEFGDVAAALQLDEWARTQPASCLASLKAQWQAEALEELGPGLVGIIDRSQAKRMAQQLRRQAKGRA